MTLLWGAMIQTDNEVKVFRLLLLEFKSSLNM